jgi:hypothetical protein
MIDTSGSQREEALMNVWRGEELSKIGTAEELRIRPLRRDGTLRSPTIIWVVRHGEDLYVRPVNGLTSGWFRGTQERLEGHIQCGGVNKDVTFVSVEAADEINAAIDAAYRAKYRRYPGSWVDAVLTPEAKSATIKLQPRS